VTSAKRADDDRRFAGSAPGLPEPFFEEVLPLLPRGLALDVAAGSGRHSLAMARAGLRVVAVDHSIVALGILREAGHAAGLCVWPLAAELENLPMPAEKYDLVVNINFLDRTIVPTLKRALKPGGLMLFDTFLVDQATLGHPRNPDYLLGRYELHAMLDGFELLRYREGLTIYRDGSRAWRAGALAHQNA
jgi:tellurite methyltransferase